MSDATFRPVITGKDIIGWALKAVAMLGSMIAAGALVIWLAGHRDANIDNHERRLAALEAVQGEQGKTLNAIQEMTARIDERVLLILHNAGPLTTVHKP